MTRAKPLPPLTAPIAEPIDHPMEIHGHRRNDPYYWLRDDNRQDPKVLAYLQAENDYTAAMLAHTEPLQQQLYQEMTERLEPNETSVPLFFKGYWRWSQFIEGKDYRINIRQKGSLDAPQEILLDQNLRAEGHEYYRLAALAVSPLQDRMAITEDFISRRQYQLRIKDLSSGEFYPEVIENCSGDVVWCNDNQSLYYVRLHPVTQLPYQVYCHRVGSDPDTDRLVYQELDDTYYIDIFKTRSERFIGINLEATQSSETRFVDANDPTGEFKLFLPREKHHLYHVDHIGEQFFILSDQDAPNNKLFKVSQNAPRQTNWQPILPHRDDTLIEDFILFDQHIATSERINGQETLRVRDFDGQLIEQLHFEDGAYSVAFFANPDPASQVLRYYYSSMTTPDSEFEYDLASKTSKLLKQDKVLGDFDSANYHSERILITASDGTKVPVSLVYRKDSFNKDGSNPLLNYGYGSYGITMDPHFSLSRLSLLDRGFVYAISHIRGGKMLGRQWYEAGKKRHKMNTFSDFIDATKALIAQSYGDAKHVYAQGGSAGGLLMGAVINMAPELFHGVIADVPFVDVVTSMLDESIPLTTGEYDEWGNPNKKHYYEYMLSYSPYDQVCAQDYPNLLVVTGLHDSQVQYWEPAKWVAKLRVNKTDNNLLLLDTDMDAGHGGKSGRYQAYLDLAKEYAFLLMLAEQKNQ